MKKKLLVPIAVALVIPWMYFGGAIPISVNSEAWSPAYTNEELMGYSELVVFGTLEDSRSYVEWRLNGNLVVPSVYTVWTLEQGESIKGAEFKTTEFVVDGGTHNNIVHDAMRYTELSKGDEVVVFLTRDADGVYGANYHLTGIESGIYKISEGLATNGYVKSSYEVGSLKEALRSFN